MAGNDPTIGTQKHRMSTALPALTFTCVTLWFFCFLFNHSTLPVERLISEEGDTQLGKAPHVDSDHRKNSNEEEPGSKVNTAHAHARHSNHQKWPSELEEQNLGGFSFNGTCDLAWGRWVRDEHSRQTYDESCPDIFKGWNCLRNNKSNAKDILAWRWQPWQCDLPRMNATLFLERFRNKQIGFIGDSLNRNMYVSFVCSLKKASQQVKKWRPAGADKALTFLGYNLTVAYHRTNLLARYGWWEARGGQAEKLGFRVGYRVDVDVPQNTWAEAPQFHDMLILNTGHWWWAPQKFDPVKSPMVFFNKGEPIVPPLSPGKGLDLVLKNMLAYVDKKMRAKGLRLLRTQSPRHFEGGDWNEGGTCHRHKPLDKGEAKAFFSLDGKHVPNAETSKANLHLRKAIQGTSFQLLNISYMSSLRPDAHPSLSGGKLHEDCMHWCLPGVTDTWNDMLVLKLLQHQTHKI